MRITREDAESWYRGDEDQNLSAHQVAVFYRGEMVKLEDKVTGLAEMFKRYAKHLSSCIQMTGKACSCGFDAAATDFGHSSLTAFLPKKR